MHPTRRTLLPLLTAFCVAAWPAAARADRVTLRPVADATLFESAPNDNMGGWTHVAAGTTGSQADRTRNRGLFRFDLAAGVPSGARITNVILTLKVVGVPGNTGGGGPINSVFALHRLLLPWAEGDKLGDRGFPADPGEVTWNARFAPDQLWTAPGGAAGDDFQAAASATALVAGKGGYQFGPTPALIADAQIWLDTPARNFGWMFLSQSEPSPKTARRFASREDPDNAPLLLVEYASAPTLRLESARVVTNRFHFQFTAPAGQGCTVEFTDELAPAQWLTLTNVPPPSADTSVEISDTLAARRRVFRLRSP